MQTVREVSQKHVLHTRVKPRVKHIRKTIAKHDHLKHTQTLILHTDLFYTRTYFVTQVFRHVYTWALCFRHLFTHAPILHMF